jgi:squalene-hopene/tetraprenyl-beta-curcumene cyclase
MHLSLLLIGSLLAADSHPTDDQVRAVIERSLPFIQGEGQRWIDEKKCVTCHQVPFMVWSLNAAADRGIVLDREKLADCSTWATDWQHMATKEDLEKGEQQTLARHNDPVAQLLLGRSVRDRESSATWPALFAERLAAGQQDDGSWKAGGQLPGQKRPERETHEVTTMWSLVALQSYGPPDESVTARFAKARSWLGSQTEGQSTEWWAVRLLLERASGNSAEADRLRAELLKRQHADSGWGWLTSGESDAFGTGAAVYALAKDGLAADNPAVIRARQFLVATQQPGGSWPIKGTKKAKANQFEPTSIYWGTCWAVIGLAETLPLSPAK